MEQERQYQPIQFESDDHPLDYRGVGNIFGLHMVTFLRQDLETVVVRAGDIGGGRWCKRCATLNGVILQTQRNDEQQLYELAKRRVARKRK
jgi:hypothetical protein